MSAGKISPIAVLILSFFILPDCAQAKYSGGSGEPNDPYQIANVADLLATTTQAQLPVLHRFAGNTLVQRDVNYGSHYGNREVAPVARATSDLGVLNSGRVDLSGTWVGTISLQNKTWPMTFVLSQQGNTVTGFWQSPGSYPTICGLWMGVLTGTINGNGLSFTATSPWKDLDTCELICLSNVSSTATIRGDTISGDWSETNCEDGTVYSLTYTVSRIISFLDADNESRSVSGAVADGSSRVIVELHGVQSSADVTISAGDVDGTWVPGPPTLQNGVWRRTWQAPESFGGSADDSIQGKRLISFAIVIDGQSIASPSFYLYKAPVVLLHGLWGDPGGMTNLYSALKADGYQFVHSVQYPNKASFSANAWVPQTHVRQALDSAINHGLVAKKADIVGYSMGGCIAKLYGHSSYIRRIVTIGTPHYGSPWANWLLASFDPAFVKKLAGDAVLDLQTTPVCNVPGDKLHVPVRAIAGQSSSDTFPGSGGDVYSAIFSLATLGLGTPSQVHTARFGNDTSDWVVSVPSQAGGLTATVVHGTWHMDEPRNLEIIGDVTYFLNAPTGGAGTAIAESTQPQIRMDLSAIASPVPQNYPQFAEEGGEITITAPSAGTIYSPGDTVHVSVVVPSGTTKVWVATLGSPAVISETPPFAIDITIPQEAIGQISIFAVAWGEEGCLATTSTVVNVTTPAIVTSLKVWPDSVLYLRASDTVPFVVHGVFSDGVERDITTSQCGTVYNTTDSLVASIDTNGILTAKAPGYCSVIVSNCVSMQITVLVQASAIIGDFNGDGKVDFADFAFLANQWQGEPSYPSADIAPPPYGDGVVDYLDLAEFTQHWLEGTWHPIPGDLNGDSKINFADFSLFADDWLKADCEESNNWCEGTDFDHIGSVDMLDLATFASHWLEGI
jgi:pimeloyl-ACP methyl ester carboxylesterase